MSQDRRDDCDYADGRPGLYRLERELMVAGRWVKKQMLVHNPAYGRLHLDAWEEEERRKAAQVVATMNRARASLLHKTR